MGQLPGDAADTRLADERTRSRSEDCRRADGPHARCEPERLHESGSAPPRGSGENFDEALRKSLSEPIGAKRDGKQSQAIENMERETGIEPATSSLGSWHSTAELLPHPNHCSFMLSNFHMGYTPLRAGSGANPTRTSNSANSKSRRPENKVCIEHDFALPDFDVPECLTSAAPYELPFGTW